ncbi:MAG: hypothetical protein ACRYF5_16570 [Janthinobacterium lividum]
MKDGKEVHPPADVLEAIHAMMANDGALFDKVESASDGQVDGKLGSNNFHDAARSGILKENGSSDRPLTRTTTTTTTTVEEEGADENDAANRADLRAGRKMARFMEATGTTALSASQMAEIARDGKFTDKDGHVHFAPEGVQNAAKRMMAGSGDLFHRYETAANKTPDATFTPNDFRAAIDSGAVGGDDDGSEQTTIRKKVTTIVETFGGGGAVNAARTLGGAIGVREKSSPHSDAVTAGQSIGKAVGQRDSSNSATAMPTTFGEGVQMGAAKGMSDMDAAAAARSRVTADRAGLQTAVPAM